MDLKQNFFLEGQWKGFGEVRGKSVTWFSL